MIGEFCALWSSGTYGIVLSLIFIFLFPTTVGEQHLFLYCHGSPLPLPKIVIINTPWPFNVFSNNQYSLAPVIWFKLEFHLAPQRPNILYHQCMSFQGFSIVLQHWWIFTKALLLSSSGCQPFIHIHKTWGLHHHQSAGDQPQKPHFRICSKDHWGCSLTRQIAQKTLSESDLHAGSFGNCSQKQKQ